MSDGKFIANSHRPCLLVMAQFKRYYLMIKHYNWPKNKSTISCLCLTFRILCHIHRHLLCTVYNNKITPP